MTAVGAGHARLEGREKVTGSATYAFEVDLEQPLYAWPVLSTIARGEVARVEVPDLPGVVTVLTHENAPRLGEVDDTELLVLQSREVAYRGQVVALVVAETQETAREAAGLLSVTYDELSHDVLLREDHPGLYRPGKVNPEYPADTDQGDVDGALASAAVTVDHEYSTPAVFNNPMEPHATSAQWDGDALAVTDSTQTSAGVKKDLAQLFGVDPSGIRVRAEHVGGGFGSKGSTRPSAVLAVMAARVTGRPVKLAMTRQMQFSLVGYRTPTIQRVRLGCDADGVLSAISHEAVEQSSTIFEFAEQTTEATRHVYAAPHRRTTHRLVRLDVPTPRWFRAPGEAPGMYALESAMDELAAAAGIDPVELRLRNDTDLDPATGQPFSSRSLAECLRRGAERFGWAGRDPRPGVRREGRFLVGTGMAAATYPAYTSPSSARITASADGRFKVGVNATDIGTGARTAVWQIAADALGVDPSLVDIDIADSDLPTASGAGGSSGTSSWGWAVTDAAEKLRAQLVDGVPAAGITVEGSNEAGLAAKQTFVRQAFGAHFVEARVDLDSGEVHVPRMLGVFGVGRVVNPRTARSQLVGGMTMGLSMALHEHGDLDLASGDYANHDFATYHISTSADVGEIEVEWVEESDPHLNPFGGKGIGEIGIVGSAAAVTNAVWHASGTRVRDLPVQPDKLLAGLPAR